MTGLTLDTGALVALERRAPRALALVDAWRGKGRRITIPTVVVVDWWRGQRGPAARLLEAFFVEPLSDELAHIAGVALGLCGKGSSPTDAVVMASAAQRGDVVYTSDFEDLERLRSYFPNVRVLGV